VRLAGDVEEYGGDRPREQRAPVDAGQHDDRGSGLHGEGERQQYRDAIRAAQARQHADDDAQHDADRHHADVVPRERDGEAVDERAQVFHHALPAQGLVTRDS
jgi:hypothetical protein